jgi:tetratricopeptide (TPR) repeat protein
MSGNQPAPGNLGKHADLAKLIREWLLAVAAVITLATLLYFNWRIALFAFLVLSVFATAYLLAFRKVSSPIIGGPTRRWGKDRPRLWWALVAWLVSALVSMAGLAWAFTNKQPSPDTAEAQGQGEPDPNVILVARLDGPDKDYGVTETVIDRLREAVGEFPDVKVKVLDEVVTPLQGSEVARQKGKDMGAGIVLWGWYRKTTQKTLIDVRFEMLRRPERMPSGDEKTSLILACADLETFKIHQDLSEKVNCLVLLAVGLVRYEAKDYDGAIARFTKAIDHYAVAERLTRADTFFLLRGKAYAIKEEYTKAIADFDRMIGNFEPGEKADELASALTARGMAYVRSRELKKALADFDRVVPLKPQAAYAINNRGITSFRVDRANARRAVDDISRAIELDPTIWIAYINRAGIYAEIGEHEKAFRDCDELMAKGVEVANARYVRGNVYFDMKQFDKAIAEYALALEEDPQMTRALYSRGNAFREKGEFRRAIMNYDQALKLNPHFTYAYAHRGIAYLQMGDLRRAADDFDATIALGPKVAEGYINRGILRARSQDYDRAIEDYTQAIKLSPRDPRPYFNRAIAYGKKNRLDDAIADYTVALRHKDPREADVLNNRGNAYLEKGDGAKAFADFDRAIEIDPKNVLPRISRGRAHAKKGNKASAIKDFKQALGLAADDDDLRPSIEKALRDLGAK